MRKDFYNASGCKDPTAYEAIKAVEREEKATERYKRLRRIILGICDLAGFQISIRSLKDKSTGKIWKE